MSPQVYLLETEDYGLVAEREERSNQSTPSFVMITNYNNITFHF